MRTTLRYRSAVLLAAALAFSATPGRSALAATVVWTGNGNNDQWHNQENWNTNGVPTGNDDVVFGINGSPTMAANGSARSLTFSATDIWIGESMPNDEARLFLFGPTAISVSSTADPDIAISPEVVFAGSAQNIAVYGDRQLILTGGLSQGLVPVTINKIGGGVLEVYGSSNANPLTGNFNVLAGTLVAGYNALGTAQINVGSGATLKSGFNSSIHNAVHVGGNGVGGLGALADGTFQGDITLTANTLIKETSIHGSITDGANNFRLTLAPNSSNSLRNANTYDGGTVLGQDARLTITNANALGTGRVEVLGQSNGYVYLQVNGGSVANEFVLDSYGKHYEDSEGRGTNSGVLITPTYHHNAISGNIRVQEYAGVSVQNEGSLTLDGAVLHDTPGNGYSSSLGKFGLGKLVLTNTGNTFTRLWVREGTVHAAGQGTIAAATVTIDKDATLEVSGSLTHDRSIRIGGQGYLGRGALRSVAGDNTITHQLIVTATGMPQQAGIVGIGVEAGSTLTLGNDILLDTEQYRVGLRKLGEGALILEGEVNEINRDFFIEGGAVSVATDAQLGRTPSTIFGSGNSKLLVRESMSTGRTFNFTNAAIEAAAGKTLTFHGIVNGATLRGPGSFHFAGGSTLANVNTLVGTTITQSDDVTAQNLTHRGNLTNTAGTLTWDGGVNHGKLDVYENVATRYLLNAGRINVFAGATLDNSGSDLYSTGGSRISIENGAAVDLGGYDLHLDGALLTNNGAITGGTVHVNYGSTLKGSGTFGQVAVGEGGVFSPGNSPGLTRTGDVTFAAGGTYLWEIADAIGLPAVQHDLWLADNLLIAAGTTANTRFTIQLVSLLPESFAKGAMVNFDPEHSYQWTILEADSITGFDPAKFALDTTGIANDWTHDFAIWKEGNSLVLGYNTGFVPEPASLVLMAIGATLLLGRRRENL